MKRLILSMCNETFWGGPCLLCAAAGLRAGAWKTLARCQKSFSHHCTPTEVGRERNPQEKSGGWIRHEKAWSCVSSHSQGYFAGGCLVNPPSSSVKKEGQKSGSSFFLQFYISSQSSAGYKEKNSQQNTQNPIWLLHLKRCLDLEKWAKIRTRKNWIQDNWVQKVQMKKIDHKWVKEVSRNVDHIISDWLESLQQPRPWPSAQPELELEHATDQFKKQKDDTGLFWRTNRSLSNNGPFNTDI